MLVNKVVDELVDVKGKNMTIFLISKQLRNSHDIGG